MKKLIVLMLSFALCMGLFVGCENKFDGITVYMPDGAPALSLVSLFDKTEIGGEKVRFVVVPSANIMSYLTSGTADLAIVPTNMAANVYNKGYGYKYVSANTHGNLFVVGKSEETSLDGLVGKVVGVIGRGQVPDLVFRSLLDKANIEYVESDKRTEGKVAIQYATDASGIIPQINGGNYDFGVMGEPAVSTALGKISGSVIALDIQQLWGGGYPQAGLVAKDSVSDEFIKALFEEIDNNSAFAEQNPAKAQELIKSHMLEGTETNFQVPSATAVQRCNVKLVKAADCKEDIVKFLTAFLELDAPGIGGKLPGDEFFRIIE